MSLNKYKIFVLTLLFCFLNINNVEASQKVSVQVTKAFNNEIDDSIPVKIKYRGSDLPEYLDYVFIKSLKASIRSTPSAASSEIYRASFNHKFKLRNEMKVNGQTWYEVDSPRGRGYIYGKLATLRTFRFEDMMKRIHDVEAFIKNHKSLGSTNSYLPNPYNKDMNRRKDKYGTSIDQNIVGVHEATGTEIHIPDRSVLSVIRTKGNSAYVKVEGIPESPLRINKRYLSYNPNPAKGFRKVIVADNTHQNLGVFEKINGTWTLISYIYGKTGIESELGFETPRGSFIVPNLKFEMGYRDLYGKDSGIANYAIRFSGGGYLHGTPIEHVEDFNTDFFMEQKEVGLGTFKGTRKCIRNTVEHAKFLFEWIMQGKINPNHNSQHTPENIMFIVI